jgi:putative hydrolase of the HAD superfamily
MKSIRIDERLERLDTLLIDMDDCLYHSPAMSSQVATNIKNYMIKFLGMPVEEVDSLCQELYASHGTTLCGLVNHLGKTIDFDHWHEHVHYGSLDYESYLNHDSFLVSMLRSLSPVARKYLFTNADRKHAQICLDILGISEFFQTEDIICFETLQEMARDAEKDGGALALKLEKAGVPRDTGILCKPSPLAFEVVLDKIQANAESTVFFDDSVRNIASAHRLGIYSVLVRPERVPEAVCDMHIQSIHMVPRELPWLTVDSIGEEKDGEAAAEKEEISVVVRA